MEDRLSRNSATNGFDVWEEPFVTLRLPKIFNLRADPFEKGDFVGMDYDHWRIDRVFLLAASTGVRWELSGHVQGISAQPESG